VAHLVHRHKLEVSLGFCIGGDGTGGFQKLTASFVARSSTSGDTEDEDDDGDTAAEPGAIEPLSLQLEWRDGPSLEKVRLPIRTVQLPITRHGGGSLRPTPVGNVPGVGQVSFITTEGVTRDSTISMFERVVLTPAETTVLQALRTIEPSIERIASIGTRARQSSRDVRGGLAMMVAGQRIPIGSMGDGIWRLLGVALALVQAQGGVLLVDEIDTGLHYSVLVDMWRLVLTTARSLDVQVFATTHSRDCYEALAAVTDPSRTEISLQRIERGKVDAIGFTEAEIQQAAERGLEVR
jgi:AAA domain, putative AbiEii toxin, Type IV TA system